MRRRDPVQATVVGIAAVTALLVAGGLALDALGALGSTGWAVVVALTVAGAILLASSDPVRLALPLLLGVVAVGLAAGAVAVSRESAVEHERGTTFTQLWVVERGSRGLAEVGVRNEERMPAAYQLRLFGPRSAGAPPLIDRTIELGPSETWSQRIVLPRTARPERVDAELYRLGETRPYRSAHVWTAPGA